MPYTVEDYLAVLQEQKAQEWRAEGWSEAKISAQLEADEAEDDEWCERVTATENAKEQLRLKLWQAVVYEYGKAEGDFWRKEKWLEALSQKELEKLAVRVNTLLTQKAKPSVEVFRRDIFAEYPALAALQHAVEAAAEELSVEQAARLAAEARAAAERQAKEEERRAKEVQRSRAEKAEAKAAAESRAKEAAQAKEEAQRSRAEKAEAEVAALKARLTAQEKRGIKRRPEGEDSVAGGLFRTQPKKEEINSLSSESSEEKTPRAKRIKRRR